jgi:Uri superfamily endonuclease
MAFLFSGLIFLIPARGGSPAQGAALEDTRERVERHLSENRRNRGEIDM